MVTQDKKTLAATNAWMDYMQILRTTLSYMEGEYNRKSESNQRITMNDFMKVKKSVDSMLQKVNKERIIASQDVPQSTTATTSTATTTVTSPTTATSSNAITPSTTSSTTTEGMYYNSSVLNETKLNEIAYWCLGDIITEKQNLHNMKNNRIRLTESQLHSIIRKCVNEAVNELDPRTYASYAAKRQAQGQMDKAKEGRNAAVKAFNKQYGNHQYQYGDNGDYQGGEFRMNGDYGVFDYSGERRNNTHRSLRNNYNPYKDTTEQEYEEGFGLGHQNYNGGRNNIRQNRTIQSTTEYEDTPNAYKVARQMATGTGKYNKEQGRWE